MLAVRGLTLSLPGEVHADTENFKSHPDAEEKRERRAGDGGVCIDAFFGNGFGGRHAFLHASFDLPVLGSAGGKVYCF